MEIHLDTKVPVHGRGWPTSHVAQMGKQLYLLAQASPPGFASYHMARGSDRQADSDDPQGDWRRPMPSPPSGSIDEDCENECDARKKSSSRSKTQKQGRRSKEREKINPTGRTRRGSEIKGDRSERSSSEDKRGKRDEQNGD